MADFQTSDIFNELSQVFTSKVDPARTAGSLDPQAVHEQLMDIAKTVFLLNPGAIFYLAKIVRNSLYQVLLQELTLAEDILIAIDELIYAQQSDGTIIGHVAPAYLNDANTALLNIDAASSIQGRPELQRFGQLIDKFTGVLRQNTVTPNGTFMLPRGQARTALQQDLAQLKVNHARLLLLLTSLRDILKNYAAISIPSKVAQSSLLSIRTQLAQVNSLIQKQSAEDNVTSSRLYLLRAVTAKVVVDLLAQFTVTQAPVSSTSQGSAVLGTGTGPFTAKAAGTGTAAQVLSAPGPWVLDALDNQFLKFKVDGGLESVVDLSEIQGPGIHGRNAAPFTAQQLDPTWPGPGAFGDPPPPPKDQFTPRNNLHISVDSKQYEFTSINWLPGIQEGTTVAEDDFLGILPEPRNDYWDTVQMQPPTKLGFKHLGSTLFFSLGQPKSSASPNFVVGSGFGGWAIEGSTTSGDQSKFARLDRNRWPSLFQPRVVTELAVLATMPSFVHVGDGVYEDVSGVAKFVQAHVGFYVRKPVGMEINQSTLLVVPTYERWEIVKVIDSSHVLIDTRSDPLDVAEGSNIDFCGTPGSYAQVSFSPDLLAETANVANIINGFGPFNIKDTCNIKIGPTIKTTQVPATQGGSISSVISALSNPANGENTDQKYAHASYHCIFKEQSGHNGKITVQGRSRFLPTQLAISSTFPHAHEKFQPRGPAGADGFLEFPGPYPLESVPRSGHEVFGFDVGQKVDIRDTYLSPTELLTLVKAAMDSDTTTAQIVETDVFGGVVNIIPNTNEVRDLTNPNFPGLGIGFGYFLELKSGDNKGTYIITDADGTDKLVVQLLVDSGFIGAEQDIEYRVFTQRVQIASKNAGPGSTVEVTQAPSQFRYPSGVQSGTVPSIQAVNAAGQTMDLSKLSPGDASGGLVVTGVSADGTTATVAGGVPSTTIGLSFAFSSKVQDDLNAMIASLTNILSSSTGLGKFNFNQNVDAIDAALTPFLTPGLGLVSSQAQAKSVVASLISILTSNPREAAHYSTTIPVAPLNIEDSIKSYDAPRVPALDSLLDSLNEYKFDRSLSLLITGQLSAFFLATAETASFSGNTLAAAKKVVQDLPAQSSLQDQVDQNLNRADQFIQGTDPESDFSDASETLKQ